MGKLLRINQVCRDLGVGRTTVYSLMKDNQLEYVKIGKLRRIPEDSLEEYKERLRDHDQ